MVGWVSGPIGDVAAQAQGSDGFASSNTDSVDLFSTTEQLARASGNAAATLGTFDEYGRQVSAPEPTISADEANSKYAITPSSGLRPLKFDNPVPESVAQSMYAAKRDEIARADIAARAPSGFGNAATRFGLNLAGSFLDPVNAAALFVPGIGEAAAARVLGMGALDAGGVEALGLGARTAVRAVAGATAGATGGAALAGLHYGLGQQEQEDYSAANMLQDVLMGGIMGGGLHAAIGGVGDVLGQAFGRTRAASIVDADPVTRDAANRAGVAALVEGRPLDVAPLIELGGAQRAVAADTPPVADGMTRLFHGADPGNDPTSGGGRWVTTDPEYARNFRAGPEGKDVHYVDVPNDNPELVENTEYDAVAGTTNKPPVHHFETSEGLAQQMQRYRAPGEAERTASNAATALIESDAAKRAGGAPDPEAVQLSQRATADAANVSRWNDLAKLEKPATSVDPEAKATPIEEPKPQAEGEAKPAADTAPKPMTQLEAAVKQMRDNGDMDAATAREYDGLTEKAKTDEGTAKALEAAAQCMLGKF